MARGIKGKYIPKNPEKYMGDKSNIIWRSRWERQFMVFCDNNINIKRWLSEEIKIPYIKPTTKRQHNYFPDFYIEYVNAEGELIKELIEIKPYKEAVRSKKSSNYDLLALEINKAKWNSARQFCDKLGIKFRILTEKTLFRT